MRHLTQEELKDLIHYDKETGEFTWLERRGGSAIMGSPVGYLKTSGYMATKIKGKYYELHRLAFLYVEGYLPEECVDHIDRNPANNKWDNLREVSHSCNSMNKGTQSNNTSCIVGVNWCESNQAWHARVTNKGKRIYLGQFKTKLEAALARYHAELEYGVVACKGDSSAGRYIDQAKGVCGI